MQIENLSYFNGNRTCPCLPTWSGDPGEAPLCSKVLERQNTFPSLSHVHGSLFLAAFAAFL